jgi:hypothetical protein
MKIFKKKTNLVKIEQKYPILEWRLKLLTSLPDRFTPSRKTPDKYWVGGWVDTRSGLKVLERRKKSIASVGIRTPDHQDRSPVSKRADLQNRLNPSNCFIIKCLINLVLSYPPVIWDSHFVFTCFTLAFQTPFLVSGVFSRYGLQPTVPSSARHIPVPGACWSRPRKARSRGIQRHSDSGNTGGSWGWQLASAGCWVSHLALHILAGSSE